MAFLGDRDVPSTWVIQHRNLGGVAAVTIIDVLFFSEAVMRGFALAIFLIIVAKPLADPPKPREGSLKVGDATPVLTFDDLAGKNKVKLSDLKGKPTVLIFGSCT